MPRMDGVLLFNERQLYTALAVISAALSQMPVSAGATISFFSEALEPVLSLHSVPDDSEHPLVWLLCVCVYFCSMMLQLHDFE